MSQLQHNFNIAQLNSLFQNFLMTYIKPNLKFQVAELQQLLRQKTLDQTYFYLNELDKSKGSSSVESKQPEVQLKQGPILKKVFTAGQQASQNSNRQHRTTSAQKMPFSKKQNSQYENKTKNNSLDFAVNNTKQTINQYQQLVQSAKNQKVASIVSKLKVVFQTNHKKIQAYSNLAKTSYVKKEIDTLNQFIGANDYLSNGAASKKNIF